MSYYFLSNKVFHMGIKPFNKWALFVRVRIIENLFNTQIMNKDVYVTPRSPKPLLLTYFRISNYLIALFFHL